MLNEEACKTLEDCRNLYKRLSPELKEAPLKALAIQLIPSRKSITEAYEEDPKTWWASSHFYWGMWIRNFLRDKGFGEDYFGIQNLDDVYVDLVQEALGLEKYGL